MKCKAKRINYEGEVLCGKRKIWNLPTSARRGKNCENFYIMAFRRCRASNDIKQFWVLYNWWIVDMYLASPSEKKYLLRAYRSFLKYGELFGAFTVQSAPLPLMANQPETAAIVERIAREYLPERNL